MIPPDHGDRSKHIAAEAITNDEKHQQGARKHDI